MLGFIIIRHVNSETTNLLWQECYSCIRKFYDNPIVIIDDNSNSQYLTTIDLVNCTIIQSEFPKRAELLPYYYFLKYAWFDAAVILHDSVFIQKPIKFNKYNKFLWHFTSHEWDLPGEKTLINNFNKPQSVLTTYNNKSIWYGCFGVMSVITYDMIHTMNSKYNFFNLLTSIKSRPQRMMLERIFAATLWTEAGLTLETCSYFGNIMSYCEWSFNEDYSFSDYTRDRQSGKIKYPIVKLWSGR